jgi:hypothetical protein
MPADRSFRMSGLLLDLGELQPPQIQLHHPDLLRHPGSDGTDLATGRDCRPSARRPALASPWRSTSRSERPGPQPSTGHVAPGIGGPGEPAGRHQIPVVCRPGRGWCRGRHPHRGCRRRPVRAWSHRPRLTSLLLASESLSSTGHLRHVAPDESTHRSSSRERSVVNEASGTRAGPGRSTGPPSER